MISTVQMLSGSERSRSAERPGVLAPVYMSGIWVYMSSKIPSSIFPRARVDPKPYSGGLSFVALVLIMGVFALLERKSPSTRIRPKYATTMLPVLNTEHRRGPRSC